MSGYRRLLAQVLLVGLTVTAAVVAGRAVFGPSAGRQPPVVVTPLPVASRPTSSGGATAPPAPGPMAPPASVPAPPAAIPGLPLAVPAPLSGIPRSPAGRVADADRPDHAPAALDQGADLRASRRATAAQPASGAAARSLELKALERSTGPASPAAGGHPGRGLHEARHPR